MNLSVTTPRPLFWTRNQVKEVTSSVPVTTTSFMILWVVGLWFFFFLPSPPRSLSKLQPAAELIPAGRGFFNEVTKKEESLQLVPNNNLVKTSIFLTKNKPESSWAEGGGGGYHSSSSSALIWVTSSSSSSSSNIQYCLYLEVLRRDLICGYAAFLLLLLLLLSFFFCSLRIDFNVIHFWRIPSRIFFFFEKTLRLLFSLTKRTVVCNFPHKVLVSHLLLTP